MNYSNIQESLGTINRISAELEDLFIESEGEVTPEAEALEAEREAVAHLLQNDGIDALGRWLKSKEDEAAMWKAEKAAADRKQKSAEKTVAFIKGKICEVMAATGMEKAKGSYYGFTPYVSEKSAVNTEEMERLYLDIATSAAHDAGLPAYIDVVLKTTTSALKEWGATDLLNVTKSDAVRFTKPRKAE